MTPNNANFSIKLAKSKAELHAAQRLRYRVFVTEFGGATDPDADVLGVERDAYDADYDHLILCDNNLPEADNIVGAYRLLRSDMAVCGKGYYSATEFCLDKIVTCGRNSLELGRSCVDARYRNGIAMHLLWQGLAEYVSDHEIEILFGVASFHGTDPEIISHGLSFLHHNHLAQDDVCVPAYGANAISMDVLPESETDKVVAMQQIPPLIKSYLRLGGAVGEGAFVDHEFNTIDVCLVMDTLRMSQKYKDFYARSSAA